MYFNEDTETCKVDRKLESSIILVFIDIFPLVWLGVESPFPGAANEPSQVELRIAQARLGKNWVSSSSRRAENIGIELGSKMSALARARLDVARAGFQQEVGMIGSSWALYFFSSDVGLNNWGFPLCFALVPHRKRRSCWAQVLSYKAFHAQVNITCCVKSQAEVTLGEYLRLLILLLNSLAC